MVFRLLAGLALAAVLEGQSLHGLYWMIPAPGSEKEARLDLSVLKSNPYLTGVLMSARWKELEPAREKYDFSALDRGIAAVREGGKQYKLAIVPGMDSPKYIYAAGAERFPAKVINPNRPNYGEKGSIPVPWDPVYQKHFSRLIRKLGERYGSDPLLVSVTLTCANFMSPEMHLPRTAQDMEIWRKLGLTSDRLLAVYEKYMDEWAASFPGRFVCLHMSPSVLFADCTADEFACRIAQYAMEYHPGKFALQRDTLMGRREMEVRPTDPMFKYKDGLLIGYQSLSAFVYPQRQGSIEMSALNFVRARAQYWELWQGDGRDTGTCSKVATAMEEARKLGYEKYKQKLIAAGLFRTPEQDTWEGLQQEMKAGKDAKKATKQ
jgi:hypothetical protein